MRPWHFLWASASRGNVQVESAFCFDSGQCTGDVRLALSADGTSALPGNKSLSTSVTGPLVTTQEDIFDNSETDAGFRRLSLRQ